jgi:MFS family permease
VTGVHWGFLSFSAALLHEEEGLSYTSIGLLLPVFGVVNVMSVALVGLLAPRVPHKLLLLAGLALVGLGHAGVAASAELPALIAAFALIGVGYAAFTTLPYPQIRLLCGGDARRYDAWYLRFELSLLLSSALGRLLAMLSATYVADRRFAWRLPWMLSVVGVGANFVAVLGAGRYLRVSLHGHVIEERIPRRKGRAARTAAQPQSQQQPPQQPARRARSAFSYQQKLVALYCNPVLLLCLLGAAALSLALGTLALWTPAITLARFGDEHSEATLNLSLTAAMALAMPVGVALTAASLRLAKSVPAALRLCGAFVGAAAAALAGHAAASHFLESHAALALFVGPAYFPLVFYKQLPDVLGLPAEGWPSTRALARPSAHAHAPAPARSEPLRAVALRPRLHAVWRRGGVARRRTAARRRRPR